MLVLELGQIEDIFVDDDIEVAGLVVGGHIGGRECFGHGECITSLPEDRRSILNSLDKTQRKEQREQRRKEYVYEPRQTSMSTRLEIV
jgi:hypothetical protein